MSKEIIINQKDIEDLNNLLNKICQDSYSSTEVIPKGAKTMLRTTILNTLKDKNE